MSFHTKWERDILDYAYNLSGANKIFREWNEIATKYKIYEHNGYTFSLSDQLPTTHNITGVQIVEHCTAAGRG